MLNKEEINNLLKNAKTIAVVGLSANPSRTSFSVTEYMQDQGYKIYPVNPLETEILGEKVYPDLKSLPIKPDIVNVFRRSELVMPIVDECIELNINSVWFQLGVINEDAIKKAEKHSIKVVQPKLSLFFRLKKYIKPYYKNFAFSLFLLLLNNAIKVSGPIIIQKATDDYIIPKNFNGLSYLLGFYIVILLLGFYTNFIQIIQLETIGQSIVAKIKKDAFSHLLTLDMSYFDKSATGRIVSRIENDTNEMTVIFTSFITTVLGSILLLVSMLGVIAFKYNSLIALTLFIFIPIIIVSSLIFNKFISPRLLTLREAVADVSAYVTEIINGMAIVQIFAQEKRILDNLEEKSNKKLKLDKYTNIFFNTFFNVLFFMQSIATVAILYIGTDLIIKGQMTLGMLILFINSLSYFFMPIIELSGQISVFQKGISGAIRIFELFDTKSTIEEKTEAKSIPNTEKGINIEFRNVFFRYTEKTDWILKDVSFSCPAGQHWALVGPTGSGKTTIISLLLKFYLPQQGQILLNGVDIQEISKEELRESIGLVLQENILFPGTVYQNLTLNQGKNTQDEVKLLMEDIGVHNPIMNLKNGYETEIKENGNNISAGEKQLISFGRALLKKPQLLIFDEATSNIDPEIEKNIQYSMNNLMKGRTSLIIAHRLSTIRNSDKILVLKHGEVIESGTHDELIKLDGFYANLNKALVV